MIDEEDGRGPPIIVFYTIYGCNVFAEQCENQAWQQIPCYGCLYTHSTIHNIGLMKLMGQNTVSILKGTKHLTRLLGLCPGTVTD